MTCCIIPPASPEALAHSHRGALTAPAPSLESVQHRCERPTARPPRRKTATLATVALLALSACAVEVAPSSPAVEREAVSPLELAPIAAPAAAMPEPFAEAISVAVAEWNRTYGGAEHCDASELRVIEAADSEIEGLCGWRADQIHACYAGRGRLVIKAAHPRREKIHSVVHEALHWLSECSGAFPDAQPKHDAPEVWTLDRSGVLGRVLDQLFGDRMLGRYPAELYAAEAALGVESCNPFGPRVIEAEEGSAELHALCGASEIRGCNTADAIVIVRPLHGERSAKYDANTRMAELQGWLASCSSAALD